MKVLSNQADAEAWLFSLVGAYTNPAHAEDDDFVQADLLSRLMAPDEQKRLIANLAGNLAQVKRRDVLEQSIQYFHCSDRDFGERLLAGLSE